jgi:hypothetical protein
MIEAIKKIHADILDRSLKKNFTLMPIAGEATHEFDYSYCVSNLPELKNYIIVTSKKLIYKNQSLTDFKREFYLYDKEGNFLQDQSILKKYQDLYSTLKEINEDLS